MSAQSDYELAQSMGDTSPETRRQYAACLVQRGTQLDQAGDLAGEDACVPLTGWLGRGGGGGDGLLFLYEGGTVPADLL